MNGRSLPDPATDDAHQGVDVRASWLPLQDGGVASWLHLPKSARLRSAGVLICPPTGHEYAHTHRTLRRLANVLADHGFAALRIDYPGSGDSTGHELTPRLFDRWLEAVDAAAHVLENHTGAPPTVIGLRLGATIAGALASRRTVGNFVAWVPVTRGKRFIREQEAMRRIAGQPPREPSGVLEAGGFRFAPQVVDAIESTNLLTTDFRIAGEALVIERADLDVGGRFADSLRDQGIVATEVSQNDYLDMVAEPQFARVPTALIDQIVEWLEERDDGSPAGDGPEATPPRNGPTSFDFGALTEEFVEIETDNGRSLFGVVSGPREKRKARGPCILLVNGGSTHHVGPHRLYVELARALAHGGVRTLRFDLQNLGDSTGLPPREDEGHPYPADALLDVDRAASWLADTRGCTSLVVAGLCSGAHTAFHAGFELTDHPITAVLPINPLTFYWHDGLSLDTPDTHQTITDSKYYGQALKDPSAWQRLLKGQSNVWYIGRFVIRRLAHLAASVARRGLEAVGARASSPLSKDLARFELMGRRVHFVFSATDPGYEILRDEARRELDRLTKEGVIGVTIIHDADHTLSRKAPRDSAIRAIVDWATVTLGSSDPAG